MSQSSSPTKVHRVAVGGIHTECSTSSPVLMQAEDFRVVRGADLPVSDSFSFLQDLDGIELFPLLHARAVPGGPVSRATYEAFKQQFLKALVEALPLDGLYLAMHGAMNVEGLDDAEGDWIAAARAVVGRDCLVAASYDLHGNVSQAIVDHLDIFAAYRTAPHIDVRETMLRAWTMLITALETGQRPGVVWAPVPVLLPGERTSTEDQPAKRLYAALSSHDQRPGIWDANLLVGYVWADEPRATACAVVTAINREEALRVVQEIAQSWWDARREFQFGPVTGPLDRMLELAEAAGTRPVILADSGDNPTGGGVGDRADVLAALLARRFDGAILAGIADRPAVDACFGAGVGSGLSLRIGGSLDPRSPSVEAVVTVLRLEEGETVLDRQAVVALDGIILVLAARRRPYHRIEDFTRLGLELGTARLLVVKSGYLSPELQPLANPNLMALTDGVINQDIVALQNHRRQRPIFPFQDDFDFVVRGYVSARWSA